MTDKQIIDRRKELEEQVAYSRRSFITAEGERNRAINELAQVKTLHADALVESFKRPGVDVDTAAQREDDALRAMETTKVRVNAAHRAREVSEAELRQHLADNFDVFAKDALKQSERAEHAVRIVNDKIAQAEALWRQAAAAWRPLVSAISEPRAEVTGVPDFPLASATVPARPPSITLRENEGEAA